MTEIPYHRIAAQFYNRPLALLPSQAETISAFLLSRIGAGPRANAGSHDSAQSFEAFRARETEQGTFEFHSTRASRFHGSTPLDNGGRPLPFRRTEQGVAIITIVGELVNRGAWVGANSGLVSFEGIKAQLAAAGNDPQTKAVILDIESPGGEAVGMIETAAAVRDLAAVKDVVAVANGMAASAAYAIASGARRIVVMPSGLVGSIGLVMVHLDFSKYLEAEGVLPTLIYAGGHKVDGNPFQTLPDSVRSRFQNDIESFYGQFVESVAIGRSAMNAERVRATEALVYQGQDAVASGLADSVGTFDDVLAELSRGLNGRAPPAPSSMKGKTMDPNTGAAAAVNAATTQPTAEAAPATHAPAPQPQPAADHASIAAQAAEAERNRILGIEKVAGGRHGDLVAKLKADGKTTPEQAALAILEADNAKRAAAAEAVKGVESETGQVAHAATTDAGAATRFDQTPDGWRAEWESSDKLKADFPTADSYVATKRRDALKLVG